MSDLDWRGPTCEPLDRVSPSALNALMACPKRLAFQRDPETMRWDVQSVRTALGRAAHKLTELVAVGSAPPPTDRKEWLEARWAELVEREYLGLQRAWTNREVPAPKDWPGYVATRVRLIRRLVDLPVPEGAQGRHGQGGDSGSGRPFPWVERQLEDQATRLFGTPDRVEEHRGRLRVLDLKSGVHQAGISDDQLRQLLIYAHLVYKAEGRLPDEVVIQDIRGHEEVVKVVLAEVEQVVAEANLAIDSFNAMLGTTGVAAHPDPEVCQWCPFRVVCADYWATRREDWPRLDVRGVVAEYIGENSVRLDLETQVGGASDFRVLLTSGVHPEVGDELVVLDLERAGPGSGRMRWNSRVRAGA